MGRLGSAQGNLEEEEEVLPRAREVMRDSMRPARANEEVVLILVPVYAT